MIDKLHIIRFYGSLGKRFGTEPIKLYGNSVKDIFQGLCVTFGNEFKNIIRNGNWHITKGKRDRRYKKPNEQDNFIAEIEVDLPINEIELHIFPAIIGAGGKSSGFLQIIVGIILIVAAIFTYGATLYALTGVLAGAAAIAGGIMTLTAKTPTISRYEQAEVDKRPSFIFNGAVNSMEQGGPVPVVCGLHLTGSTVISSNVRVRQI